MNVLIVFSNPYVFESSLLSTVEKLSEKSKVSILLTNYYLPDSLHNHLKEMRDEGLLSYYEVIPAWNEKSLATGIRRRTWVKEVKFWKAELPKFNATKFDLVIGHTGAETYDWIPLTRLLKPSGVTICAFPNQLPLETVAHRSKFLHFSRKLLSLNSNARHSVIRRLINPLCEKVILKHFSRDEVEPRNLNFSIIGPFPFDLYAFSTRPEYERFHQSHPELRSELVSFPFKPLQNANQPSDEQLLILLDLPDDNGTLNTSELMVDLAYVMNIHEIKHVHIRPHPRDRTQLAELLEAHIKERFANVSCLRFYGTLQSSVISAGVILGRSSSSLDHCIRFAMDQGMEFTIYQSTADSFQPNPRQGITENCINGKPVSLVLRWPPELDNHPAPLLLNDVEPLKTLDHLLSNLV